VRNKDGIWVADEKAHYKSLKNDRMLINEGWKVLKISNWEIKDPELLENALQDIRSFFGF